jgi:catechol 2,3-dioxygenase-like lactoylglutathione lyase family enzyme
VSGLHHVGLAVGDLEHSIAFYQALLGCRIRERSRNSGLEIEQLTGVAGADIMTADLELPDGALLELIQYVSPKGARLLQDRHQPGHTHLGFVIDNVDAARERLATLGAHQISGPLTIVEPGSAWDGARVLYACDPDGRTIECLEAPGPAI